mmetsp:Transcript_24787/g.41116  ORF Transcript_24787/g.41116 Transcript_24787/m.41116 type:complete len:201 (-) Transcript_24787:471-1073(-)
MPAPESMAVVRDDCNQSKGGAVVQSKLALMSTGRETVAREVSLGKAQRLEKSNMLGNLVGTVLIECEALQVQHQHRRELHEGALTGGVGLLPFDGEAFETLRFEKGGKCLLQGMHFSALDVEIKALERLVGDGGLGAATVIILRYKLTREHSRENRAHRRGGSGHRAGGTRYFGVLADLLPFAANLVVVVFRRRSAGRNS